MQLVKPGNIEAFTEAHKDFPWKNVEVERLIDRANFIVVMNYVQTSMHPAMNGTKHMEKGMWISSP